MPTGYTADLYDGKDVSFEEFAFGCARAFGALIEMRDAPRDAEIPEEFAADTSYNDERLAKALETLKRLETLPIDKADAEAHHEWLSAKWRYEEVEQSEKDLRGRYEAMLEQVRRWQPPTPDHVQFKTFMVEQLSRSIEWDTVQRAREKPQRLTAEEWIAKERENAERAIKWHTTERAKKIERAAERTAWVKALRESLGGVPA